MPTTRSGLVVAAAISVTDRAEVFVARIASGSTAPLELAEELALDLEVLERGLDHELAGAEVGQLGDDVRRSSAASFSFWVSRPFSTPRER